MRREDDGRQRRVAPARRERRWLLVTLALLVALAPASASAQWLGLRSDTLLGASGARPAFGASDTRAQVPLYELVQLHLADLGLPGLQLEVSGVAGVHLATPPLGPTGEDSDRAFGQLVTGLLRWQSATFDARRGKAARFGVAITAGRQYLFAGAGRAEHLDGLSLEVRSPWNLDLTLFGGRTSPWQVDYEPSDGPVGPANEPWYATNYAAGGRARFRLLDHAVVAVGFVHEGHGSQTVRQSLALDAGYWSSRYLEVLAGSALDTVQWLPAETWVQLVSRPRAALKLTADYSYQIPSLTVPKTSIFSVFSLDELHEASLGVHWGATGWLTLGLEGGARLFPAEDGLRVGYTVAGETRFTFGAARLAGLRVELLDAEGERLLQGRLHALYTFAFGLYSSAEVYALYLTSQRGPESASVFERRIGDQPLSIGGLGVVGYRFTPQLALQVAGSAFSTPSARHDLRLLARFTYEASWGGRR